MKRWNSVFPAAGITRSASAPSRASANSWPPLSEWPTGCLGRSGGPTIKGPFSKVEAFLRAGRYKDAADALKLSARTGTQAWEIYLWLGRIEENRGRLAKAEQVFRMALNANPTSPLPRVELSRLLEKTGQGDEAQGILREVAARAVEDLTLLSEHLLRGEPNVDSWKAFYSLMEFNLYRRAFLESVIQKSSALDRIETAMRLAFSSAPQAGARTLLAELLIVRGRLDAAEAELAPAFLPGATGSETSRIEALLRLIERGRFGPDLERALLGCISRAEASDKLAREWPQIFSALMCASLYAEAFRLGEAVLDKFGKFECPGQLLWPWWRKIRRGLSEERFIGEELARIRAAEKQGGLSHWFAYYRAVLLNDLGRNEESMVEYRGIRDLSSERYSWMFQSFVLVKLMLLDFEGAIEICRSVLKREPSHWWVRCRMAEAYLAKGDTARALREFERALDDCDPLVRREVLTWHGEILLWLGEYARALEQLNEAIALGSRTFVHGWRGAVHLKLGRHSQALADLDRAVELDPKDVEARIWRGEAYRLLERNAEAIQDLDHAIGCGTSSFWAYVNRALSRGALGDEAGLAEDYSRIPEDVTSFLSARLHFPERRALTTAQMREMLIAGLKMAKGIRRWENYVQPIWMGRRP